MASTPGVTSSGIGAAPHKKKLAFYKKIQAAKAQGDSAKTQNLTARYRARVATRDIATGQTDQNTGRLDPARIQAALKKFGGTNPKARKRTLAASRRLSSSYKPGTPGGTA